MKTLIIVCALIIGLSGCSAGSPAENFLAGFGTAVAVKLNEGNEAMKFLDEKIEAMNAAGTEMEVLSDNPVALVTAIDPNLGTALNEFIVNAKSLAAKAETFKDEKGKIDWDKIVWSLLVGGTGVNIFKNWRAKS
jgi:hypothetical protein